DGRLACGICDFCAPSECQAQQFRPATTVEREAVLRVVDVLRAGESKTTGRLHGELYPGGEMTRDEFEEVVGAMARSGWVRLADAICEKDGKQIPYRKVSLTRNGADVDEATAGELVVKDSAAAESRPRSRKKRVGGSGRKARRRKARAEIAKPAPARPAAKEA